MPSIVHNDVVRVKGYTELTRAFAVADKSVRHEMQAALRDVAEPIRSDAEHLAKARIRNIGRRWGLMRTGLTTSVLYVAPRERGKQSRRNRLLARPNLAGLLIDKAMQPALDKNEAQIAGRFDEALGHIERIWEQA